MTHMVIRGLDFRNLVHVFEADRARNLVAWSARAFFDAGCFLEEIRSRRCFGNECERSVWLYGDESGCRNTRLDMCRPRVEFFAEIHGLHATGTQCRSYGGSWCCLSSRDKKSLDRR